MNIEGQGHFFIIYFPGLYVLCFTRQRYQVNVNRTIGPLVIFVKYEQRVQRRLIFATIGFRMFDTLMSLYVA